MNAWKSSMGVILPFFLASSTAAAQLIVKGGGGGGPSMFEDFSEVACRGNDPHDNSDHYYHLTTARSLHDCKSNCGNDCFGVEYSLHSGRCELWNRKINSGTPKKGFLCSVKQQPPPTSSCSEPVPVPCHGELILVVDQHHCPIYECIHVPHKANFDDFTDVACRGNHPHDSSDDYFHLTTARSLHDCKSKCGNHCFGVEYSLHSGRCELWNREINSGTPRNGFVCSPKAYEPHF
jgi:hypothetical protein